MPAEEITRDIVGGGIPAANDSHYDLPYTPGAASGSEEEIMKTNQNTLDTNTSQTLSWSEIEELKKSASNGGRDLIQKLLDSHTALDQKTPFSLQKYTLRKTSKFLRRFSVHKLNVAGLLDFLPAVKEPYRFLELRNGQLAMMMSLGNICHGGRYLVVDETGGLLVSAIAERLGLLEHHVEPEVDTKRPKLADSDDEELAVEQPAFDPANPPILKAPAPKPPMQNTITLIHANEQPNLSFLTHFGYDPNNPPHSHPLASHLKTISWLQLLSPDEDTTLLPPAAVDLSTLKPGKRASYHRKVRRWERLISTVNEARAGGFDAVLIAAHMAAPGILKALVPLVAGSGQVVVYTPSLQQITEVADLYSSSRRAQWMIRRAEEDEGTADPNNTLPAQDDYQDETPDPTLVIAPTVHRMNVRKYQVLPGRTHPVMTSRGGGEGHILHATRVLPVTGRIDARGAYAGRAATAKKRKTVDGSEDAEVEKKLRVDEDVKVEA